MGVGNVRVEEIVLTFPLMQCLYISPCITLFPTTIWTTKYSCVHVITAITPSSPLHAVQREDMNLTLQKCVTVWQLLFVQGLGIENGGIWEWEYQKKEQKTGKRREKGKQKKMARVRLVWCFSHYLSLSKRHCQHKPSGGMMCNDLLQPSMYSDIADVAATSTDILWIKQ